MKNEEKGIVAGQQRGEMRLFPLILVQVIFLVTCFYFFKSVISYSKVLSEV